MRSDASAPPGRDAWRAHRVLNTARPKRSTCYEHSTSNAKSSANPVPAEPNRANTMFVLRWFLLVVLVGLPAQPAVSQNPWAQQVRDQLVAAAVRAGYQGMYLSHEPFAGSLRDGQYQTVELELDEGVTYAIIGACDNDCEDVDLELYDADWNKIDSDTKPDDTPVVTVTPRWTDTFQVRAIMADCQSSPTPCEFGFGVFSR
jgi:hypothetical protein